MTPNWSSPAARLIMTVEQSQDREAWLAERRRGIGGSDAAAILGESRYDSPYDVWEDKTGRGSDREQTIQMEMGTRWEDAVAQKFSDDVGVAIQRRGMLQSKTWPVLRYSADRLTEDGGILECKAVNGFTKLPQVDNGMRGWTPDWWWQGIAGLAVTGRTHCYLAVAIGNHAFETRDMSRGDDTVEAAIERLTTEAPKWWEEHILGDVMPEMGRPLTKEELTGGVYEAFIPGMLLEMRDRLREVRETKRELEAEEKDIKAKLDAESGGAEWLLADGRPVLRFQPKSGRSSFQKAALFAQAPVSGRAMVEWLNDATATGAWLEDEVAAPLIAWLLSNKLTEDQFTKRGEPSRSLVFVGKDEEE